MIAGEYPLIFIQQQHAEYFWAVQEAKGGVEDDTAAIDKCY